MRKALRWLADHWYVPLMLIIGLAAFLLGARRPSGPRRTPISDTRRELAVIKAGTAAKVLAKERGTNAAVDEVMHAKTKSLDKITDKQHRKAEKLARDPVALARFLERLSD